MRFPARSLSIAVAVLALCGCTDRVTSEVIPADFGAAAQARIFVRADGRCRKAGFATLASCIHNLPANHSAALAARNAVDDQRIFLQACSDALSRERCDEMFNSAVAAIRAKGAST